MFTLTISIITVLVLLFVSFSKSKLSIRLGKQLVAFDTLIKGIKYYSDRPSWLDWYAKKGYKMPLAIHKIELIFLCVPILNIPTLIWVILRYITIVLYHKSNWSSDEKD